MSSETHGHGHDGHAHHGPTNFWTKYVFSTDHKVIGLQFTFTSLLFVIIGGLLALGVRYQIAWPMQDVPYAKLLPGGIIGKKNQKAPRLTTTAPEANIALWHTGRQVELKKAAKTDGGKEIPAGAMLTLEAFPDGLSITLPAGTVVKGESADSQRVLGKPVQATVPASLTMASYQYGEQETLINPGTQVSVGEETLTIVGREVFEPALHGTQPIQRTETSKSLEFPVVAMSTTVTLEAPAVVVDSKGNELAQLGQRSTLSVAASDVTYFKEALTTDAYLTLFTMHASVMIFFVIIPMLVGGFGNFLIPLMVGARDMAFPKLNMLSFWISFPVGLIMLVSFWVPGGAAAGGWTMYPTLSEKGFVASDLGTTLWIFGVAIVGFSSIVGALNYITTTINMRAPGMTMFRMPLTVWTLLITAILQLIATPVLTAVMILLLLDRTLGTMFFIPEGGGQPLLWQHLFWFYSHPAVYIMILPGMGVVSDIISVHSRKPIFGYKPMVFATCAIAGLGFIVWGHHMFQSGMSPLMGTTFMASTVMIALPSAIKTFNWLGTIWGGNIRFTPAMLNAIGFVSMFVIGGLSGIFMASAPIDIHIHDTYFIVAHIHYVLFGGSIFAIFAGIYHWFPKMFGRQMNYKWGVIHFILTIIAFNGTFFLMHILGIGGHPRRYASILEYPTLEHLQPMNVIMTIFAMSMGMAQIPFFYNFFVSLPRKLCRAMVAFFLAMLAVPVVIGSVFYSDALHMKDVGGEMVERGFGESISIALGAGAAAAVVIVALIWVVWAIGGKLRMPALLQRLMYVGILPAYLAPFFIKHDIYMMLNVPGLHEYRWILLALSAVPGLAYLLLVRPNDEFGAVAEENPWNAGSLEWQTASPPILTNFETIPTVHRGPYEYATPVVEEDYLPQTQELPEGVLEPTGH